MRPRKDKRGVDLISDVASRSQRSPQLEIVATIPGEGVPTYGDLRLNPCWDELRGDPRFDKIVAAAKAASR